MPYGPAAERRLVGRDGDVERIEQYVDSLTASGSVLLVTGDPGVGKSALLDLAEDIAGDRMRVLRCAGVEFEVEFAYAALNQALRPLRSEIRRLDDARRSALQVALGLSVAAPQEPLTVSNAVLDLLEQVAAERPLLVVVDDAQWLDRATAFTLAFVARRLAGARLGLLVAARTGADNAFQALRVARHELAPLGHAAAAALLSAHFPDLDTRVRTRLLTEAQGNPLALLELPVRLPGPRRDAVGTLPATLPLTERLQAVFAARLDELDDRTRTVLLLAALEGTGRLDVLQSALPAEDGLRRLGSAERAQLLSVDDDARLVRFRHPLVRGAVVAASTHDERRQAHQALADVLTADPDRHVWHLAAAAIGPDEKVAVLLEEAAHRSLRRGDGVGAVTTLVRSADLSPAGGDRSARLAEAAHIAVNLAGKLDTVAPLIERARLADASPGATLYATVAAASVLYESGEIVTAHRMLVSAIEAHAGSWDEDDDAVHAALGMLLGISAFLLTPDAWQPFHDGMDRLDRAPLELRLLADLVPDPVRASGDSLRRLSAELRGLAGEPDPWRVAKLCGAGMFVDGRHESPEPLLQVLRRSAEDDLAPTMTVHAYFQVSSHYFRTGQWELAHRHVDEGLRLADSIALTSPIWLLRSQRMLLAAAEGDDDLLAALCEEALHWAAPRKALGVLHTAYQAAGLGALGRGDYETAFAQLARISPPGVLASHAPRALATCLDLVQAAVRSGRPAAAEAHVGALEDAGVAAISPRLALFVAASEAMVSEEAVAVRAFERALGLPEIEDWPFDHARVQLALGEHLRRRVPSEARAPLRAALATFERIGARPWAGRTRAELSATGETRAVPGDGAWADLTAQERQIAELAAGGLTNREIGARLFLSHRTVGSHLHHVFPKLGITTRSALRDALNRTRPGPGA